LKKTSRGRRKSFLSLTNANTNLPFPQIATYLSILDENGPLTLQSMHGTSPASSATLPDPDQAIVIATTSSTRSKGKRKADAQHSRSNRCHEQILTRVLKSRIIK
jgi:hypothetical protein